MISKLIKTALIGFNQNSFLFLFIHFLKILIFELHHYRRFLQQIQIHLHTFLLIFLHIYLV